MADAGQVSSCAGPEGICCQAGGAYRSWSPPPPHACLPACGLLLGGWGAGCSPLALPAGLGLWGALVLPGLPICPGPGAAALLGDF